jgi:hypothetical protein
LRNRYGWGYAFAAAGVGLIIGMIILASSLKHAREGDVKKPVQAEDMSKPGKRCFYFCVYSYHCFLYFTLGKS